MKIGLERLLRVEFQAAGPETAKLCHPHLVCLLSGSGKAGRPYEEELQRR